MMLPINYAILTLALTLLKEGNIRQCESLGFTPDELNALNQLTMDELFFLSRAGAQFMKVDIQHDVLQRMLTQARQEKIAQSRIARVVALGGSIELLNRFFGLTSTEISARRRLMGITLSQGRTRHPDEQEDAQIWALWQRAGLQNPDSLEGLDCMMDIAADMSAAGNTISLTAIWHRIQHWEKEKGSPDG